MIIAMILFLYRPTRLWGSKDKVRKKMPFFFFPSFLANLLRNGDRGVTRPPKLRTHYKIEAKNDYSMNDMTAVRCGVVLDRA